MDENVCRRRNTVPSFVDKIVLVNIETCINGSSHQKSKGLDKTVSRVANIIRIRRSVSGIFTPDRNKDSDARNLD